MTEKEMMELREKMINRIEGYFGPLLSVPYHLISFDDLKKIYNTLLEQKQIRPY